MLRLRAVLAASVGTAIAATTGCAKLDVQIADQEASPILAAALDLARRRR